MAFSFADGENNDIVLKVIIVIEKNVFDEKQYKNSTPVNIFVITSLMYGLVVNMTEFSRYYH